MSAPGFQGNKYLVDINGSAGAFIQIQAKSGVRRLVIQESQITAEGAANAPVGIIQYRLPNDGTTNGFTTVFVATQGETLPIQLPDRETSFLSSGPLIGSGPQGSATTASFPGSNTVPGLQNGSTGTRMIDVRSGAAAATTLEVTEYN